MRRTVWVIAAAASVLVAVALYLSLKPSGGGPDMPGVVPVLTQHAQPERQELAQLEAPKVETPAAPETAQPMEETQLALQLKGTVKGAVPQAVIVRTDTGKSAIYSVGQEVLPGLRVAEVRDKEVVLVDDKGGRRTLSMGTVPASEVKTLEGLWAGTLKREGGAPEQKMNLVATDVAGQVTMSAKEDKSNPPAGVLTGLRTGQKLVLDSNNTEGENWHFEGTIDEAFETVVGRAVRVTEDPNLPPAEAQVKLTRISEEAAREQDELAKLEQERQREVAAMYAPLKEYADAHEGRFPEALGSLVHGTLRDLSLYANTPTRTVAYMSGGVLAPWKQLDFEAFQPNAAPSQRLIAYERELQSLWGSEIPFRVVLKVSYRSPNEVYLAATTGAVVKDRTSNAPAGATETEIATANRVQSQNNLKQLALINKMFSAEHRGMTVAGWLSVYPEYLTDALVCTAPWEDPGTNSYEVLFPAATEGELEGLAAAIAVKYPSLFNMPEDPNDPSFQARLQSIVPMFVEKHADPRMPIGRNVAFLDGHVEYLKAEEFAKRVDIFTR